MFKSPLSILLSACLLLGLFSCSDSEDDAPSTFLEAIENDDRLTSFQSILTSSSLAGEIGSARVILAPTNEAFAALTQALGSAELSQEALDQVLAYHVETSDLAGDESINRNWAISGSAGQFQSFDDAQVVDEILLGDAGVNGRLILIDRVLLPAVANLPFDGSNFGTAAADQILAVDELLSAASYMSSLRPDVDGNVSGTNEEVLSVFLSPIRENTSPAFNAVVGTWIPELVAAANGGAYHPDSSAAFNGDGGGFTLTGRRYIYDENGLEPQQVIEKGFYMGMIYNQMLAVTQSLEAGDASRLLALMGANPNFNNSSNGPNGDRVGANYIARRDQNNGRGLYSEATNAIKALQFALATEAPIAARKAADAFLLAYEKGIAATIINYLHQTNASISLNEPSDDDLSAALHAFSEGVGFSLGYIGLPTAIGDDRIAEIVNLMRYNEGPNSETFRVVTERFDSVERNTQIIGLFQQAYGFTNEEIDSFRFNWVNEQGR